MTLRRMNSWHITIGETDDGRLWAGCNVYATTSADAANGTHSELLSSGHWSSAGALFQELMTLVDTSCFTFLAGTEVGTGENFRDAVA